MYVSSLKTYMKISWFRTTASLNSIYIIAIKQFRQLLFIGDDFIFVSSCYISITYETLICKKHLDEIEKSP